jgi:hypothetical protein
MMRTACTLLPEVLSKPLRDHATSEVRILAGLLGRLDLPGGADRFITNNQRDFPATITEVTITYPAELE